MAAVARPVGMAGTATFPTIAVPRILTVLVSDHERWRVFLEFVTGDGDRNPAGKRLRSEVEGSLAVCHGPMEAAEQERNGHDADDDDQGQGDATHGKPPSGSESHALETGCTGKNRGGRDIRAPPSVSFRDMNGPAPERFRDPALVDFGLDSRGRGRRLERFGGLLVDRPLPQTSEPRRSPDQWRRTAALFCETAEGTGRDTEAEAGAGGRWEFHDAIPTPWHVRVPLDRRSIVLEVRPAASGQVGVFLEQVAQWRWLARTAEPGMRLLSLFGHSGAATLAMAAAGAEVVHVDASRQAVALARRNAAASGLEDRPIRWICDDAATFVAREARRGSSYAGAVLDPPSWGHGPRGQPFAIDADLAPLMRGTIRLLSASSAGPLGPILLTCHSPGWHSARLRETIVAAFDAADRAAPPLESGRLTCRDDAGRELDLGCFARGAARTAEQARS